MKAQNGFGCPSCGHANRSERRFCAKCGSRLGEVCAACAVHNDPGEKFCGSCGKPLSGAPPAPRATARVVPGARNGSEAERRQLTVMFCDLVASTALAESIEAEDLREVVRRYYDACAQTIQRWDGHVVQYLGDGVLAHFGYPHAHEDDAERAVRAGLDMLVTLERNFAGFNAMLEAERGLRLAARIGLHTGPVVVGDMTGGAGREALALGETVNLAARLQAVAAPDTVVISAATLRLVRGIFVTEELGRQALKGIAELVPAYRVVQASGVRSRLDVTAGALTPFVGRNLELGTLVDRWERVQEREGQTVVITGEAGVGKSRLVYQLREQLAERPHTWLECRCSPYTQDSAFHPVIELVEQGLVFQPADTSAEKIGKLERALVLAGFALPEIVPLFAALLSIPTTEGYTPLQMSPELQRRKTLEALVAWNLALGELQPVVVVIEDIHWCDPSSIELLRRLIEQSPTSRVLLVGTARPEFQTPWPPRSNLVPLQLSRLTRRLAREVVMALSRDEKPLPPDVVEAIVTRADGNPLYIEELTKTVLEPGTARDVATIPATLQDSLMARLDRLSAAKEVAQRAAVCGRDFSYALLVAVAGLEEPALRQGLMRLVEAEILFARGDPPAATYTFKHALVQEAAYESLLKRTRQELHLAVARALEEGFPAEAAGKPEVVARHYDAAGLVDQAASYYARAGDQAALRSAHEEAIRHLRRGITLLGTLSESAERNAREVPLQLALGASVIAVRGYSHPDTEAAYEQARVLCEAMSDSLQLGSALVGLSIFYSSRGEPSRGLALAERVLHIGQQVSDEPLRLHGHVQVGLSQFFQGRFELSLEHCEQGIRLYDPSRHHRAAFLYGTDQGIAALAFAAGNLALGGFPDSALRRAREAVGLARALVHPFSEGFALWFETCVHWLRGDNDSQRQRAEATVAVCKAQGFPLWLGLGMAFHGAALATAGGGFNAIAEALDGFAMAAGTGNQAGAPLLMGLLAEAHRAVGQDAEALAAVETALAISSHTGQCFWDAELYRQKGELLLVAQPENEPEAERLFRRALEIAREREARLFELRSAKSLARLLHAQGKSAEARALVAPIYGWFTEGLDTGDLVEAKALLEELR